MISGDSCSISLSATFLSLSACVVALISSWSASHPPTSSLSVLLVLVLAAAVPLGDDDHEEDGAEGAHAAPEAEDAADDGLGEGKGGMLIMIFIF